MLVRVVRTYGGLEGVRVKAGSLLAVGKPHPKAAATISHNRLTQLKGSRLVRDMVPDEPEEPIHARLIAGQPIPVTEAEIKARLPQREPPKAKVEPDSKATRRPQPQSRASARRRAQPDNPPEPERIERQNGGQTGAASNASSSQEVRQAGGVTLKQRGVRRQGGSPLTTPGGSSPGQMSSTPAIRRGGGRITTPSSEQDPAAFD